MSEIKHPEIEVKLTGTDSNGFMMASRVRHAMQVAGVPEAECSEFFDEALSGDFDHLLQTCMRWVDVS